jgi:hypothetical protein
MKYNIVDKKLMVVKLDAGGSGHKKITTKRKGLLYIPSLTVVTLGSRGQ